MRLRHVAPGVGARSTGRLTDHVGELFDQPVYVGPGVLLADAVVLHLAICDGADDCRDGVDSAESVIQGTFHCSHPLLSCEDLGLARMSLPLVSEPCDPASPRPEPSTSSERLVLHGP